MYSISLLKKKGLFFSNSGIKKKKEKKTMCQEKAMHSLIFEHPQKG